jgi:hypothetical protein
MRLNHKLGSLGAMDGRLGDESTRVTNTSDVIGEDDRSALASKEWNTQECLQCSLKSTKNGRGSLGGEERSSRSETRWGLDKSELGLVP